MRNGLSLVALAITLCPATGFAQSDTPVSAAEAEAVPDSGIAVDVTEIVVTGSRIRGEQPVGSNLIAVSAADLATQPSNSVSDFLRKVPQIQGFGVDVSSPAVSGGQGGTNTTRGSALNLRGVGPQATLALLDGRRLPSSGVVSNYVDPSAIPMIAIDRIEVVPDGSSAVYGSDAVAGVVNFIMKKDFDGLMVRGKYAFADGYWLRQAGMMAGKNWNKGGLVVAYEYSANDRLNGGERNYILSDLRTQGGQDYRNSLCSPGNIVANNISYAIPQNGVTSGNRGDLIAGTRNLCENTRFNDVLPKELRHRVYGRIFQEVGPVTLGLQGIYSSRKYSSYSIQQGSTSNIFALNVPSTNAFFVLPNGVVATSATVEYDFTNIFGPIEQHGSADTIFVAADAKVPIGAKWEFSLEGNFGQDKSEQNTSRINSTALAAALASSDPETAFNPYGGPNSQSVLDGLYTGIFNPFGTSRIYSGSALLSGELFNLPSGSVKIAVGAEYIRYVSLTGNRIGTRGSAPLSRAPDQVRKQKSVFGELYIPIFGEENATAGIQKLELTAALRHDKYNDVGSTTNPKFGMNWEPVEGVMLRGSYGTSFRAPNLADLVFLRSGATLTPGVRTDPTSPTGSSVGLSLLAGNPDLAPETAETWSATLELRPTEIPGLRGSLSYFNLDYKGLVNAAPTNDNMLRDPTYAYAVTRNPSAESIAALVASGIRITAPLPADIAWLYDARPQNSGSIKTTGLDFDMSYFFTSSVGNFNVGANGTYVLTYDFAATPNATAENQVGNISYPVKFRSRAFIDWNHGPVAAGITWNHVSGYRNNLVTMPQNVRSWNPLDARLSYTIDNGPVKNLVLGIDLTNFLNERAPFVNTNGGWDPGQASALGRIVSLSVSAGF